jgi:hypothetical protein
MTDDSTHPARLTGSVFRSLRLACMARLLPFLLLFVALPGTVQAQPGTPSLSSPTNGATVGGSSVTFSWTVPSGSPTQYELQVSDKSTFQMTAPFWSAESETTSKLLDGFPNDGTVFYWRVRASNSSGDGPWSVVRSFTNGGSSVPDAPSLSSPANGATVGGSSVTFSWTAPSGSPTKYNLQASTSSTFVTTVWDGEPTSTSHTLNGFSNNGTDYYWRVRAYNTSGWGAWSVVRSFTNSEIPPGTWTAAETDKFQLAVTVDPQGRVSGAYLKVYFNDAWLDDLVYSFSKNDITLSGKSVLAKKEIGVFNSAGDRIELYQIAGTFQPNGTLKGTWKSSYYHAPRGMSPQTNTKEGAFTGTNPAIKAPMVTTAAASGITATTATLNGTVYPNGTTTTAHFEYGLTTAYGSTVNVTLSPADASMGLIVSANISGLQPGRTYYYRLAATNEDGTSTGAGRTLATIRPGPAITVRQPAGGVLKNGAVSSIGSVAAGSKLSRTFTIQNTGTENLTKLSVSRSGKNAKDFVVKGPLKTTLPPGGKTTFKITFKPTAKGVRKALLRIRSNDKNNDPFEIVLTGKGGSKAKSAVVKSARLPSWRDLAAHGDGNRSHQTVGTTTLADGRKYLTLTVSKTPGGFLPGRGVEVSPNLIDWYSGSKHTTLLIDDAFLLKVRDNVPLTPGNKRFIRMKAN